LGSEKRQRYLGRACEPIFVLGPQIAIEAAMKRAD
jgi:hypothetical protein